MTDGVEQLKTQAKTLSAAERAELADFLLAYREESELLPLHADRPPLRVEEGAVVRVGKSRIALDLLVREYDNGMTPEDMVRAYDTLELADVYAAIAYYLRHRAEVKAYLDRREEEAARLRTLIESQGPPRPTKADLLARRRAGFTLYKPSHARND
jgi:uncharacterized protein (DUF433 family)